MSSPSAPVRALATVALILAVISPPAAAEEVPVEQNPARVTVYAGPVFVTQDPDLPEAAAVAVDHHGRVVELYGEVPRDTEWPVVTLPGRLALPGLCDAHLHVSGIGRLREQVSLRGCRSPQEAAARVQAFAAAHPELPVIQGRGWDQSLFPGRRFPTAADLDGVCDRPVILRRVDGHAAWVNRAALRAAGISAATPDPAGGRLLRDAAGAPLGVLVDNALDLLDGVVPPPDDATRERWLLAGLNACADAGLTAVHDMGESPAVADVAQRLADAGRLPIRLFVYLEGSVPGAVAALDRYHDAPRFAVVGVKSYADGALGSRGAALLADYGDDPGNRGLLVTDPDTLRARMAAVHRRGFQNAVHAIGDRANRLVLDIVADIQHGDTSRRHRVEHAQVVAPDDFPRFRELGVIASMQPTHATSDMRWAEQRLGPQRVLGAYAWRTMRDLGVPLAFGSDAPVENWDPLPGIYAAVTRQDKSGWPPGGWYPAQRLTDAEAVAAFTTGAAYAVHREGELGRLSRGYLFDVTVLDRDPRGRPAQWLAARVTAVVVGGEVVRRIGPPGRR